MSITSTSAAAAVSAAQGPRRPALLRIGLILCALLAVLSAIPAVAEIGFDGSAWDILVVAMAIVLPLIALATVALVPIAWRGRRRPALAIVWMQAVLLLQLVVPLILFATGEVPLPAVIAATISAAITAMAMVLVVKGAQAR